MNLIEIKGLEKFDTSNVTDMHTMFYGCTQLTSLDLSSFNTAKVTDMRYMFRDCPLLTTIYVGTNWIINEGTNITNMYENCGTDTTTPKSTQEP